MSEYSIVYADPSPVYGGEPVLLVKKNRPQWQAGRYNLVGGKVDPGEDPLTCAVRELKEESGLDTIGDPEYMGAKCMVEYDEVIPQPGETEEVSWHEWPEIQHSPLLLPNLQVVIPLMKQGVKQWVINDKGPHFTKLGEYYRHNFMVTVEAGDEESV